VRQALHTIWHDAVLLGCWIPLSSDGHATVNHYPQPFLMGYTIFGLDEPYRNSDWLMAKSNPMPPIDSSGRVMITGKEIHIN